jgi:hypothetical protein
MALIFLDGDKIAFELKKLQALAAKLRDELFEQCCQIQRGVDFIDFSKISFLIEHLRSVEHRIGLLRQVMGEAHLAVGNSNAGQGEVNSD